MKCLCGVNIYVLFRLGESYAGVYVPMIVKEIISHPEDGVNLKGFAVGDACTPPDICGTKQSGPFFQIQFLYGKSAFSNKLYEEITSNCSEDELVSGQMSSSCSATVAKINDEAGGYWDYGFYDNCWYENDIRRRNRQLIAVGEMDESEIPRYYGPPIGRRASTAAAVDATTASSFYIGGNGYACGGPNAQITWLSRPEVMQALHIPEDGNFFQCDNGVGFTYDLTEGDLVRLLWPYFIMSIRLN